MTVGNDGHVRPLTPRSFNTLSQAEEENGQSRIYLGIHWSFDKTEGIRQGRRVADYVFQHAFFPLSILQLSSTTYNASETDNAATITLTRFGNTSSPATVDYATIDGTASARSDYTAAAGTLSFAPGETTKTLTIFVTDDAFVEGNETLNIVFSNPTGTTFLNPATATLTINDNDTVQASTNPIDDALFFVRQHYVDFLNRAPDQ